MRRRVLALVAGALLLAGCGRAQRVADTRRVLDDLGYHNVDVSLRAGGSIGVARIQADPEGAPPAEQAAEVAWKTLPVRFDQLIVALGDQVAAYSYEDLAGRFGPRDRALDTRQVDEEVVKSGLKLMLVLSAGAILSVAAVVFTGLGAVKAARRTRHHSCPGGSCARWRAQLQPERTGIRPASRRPRGWAPAR